MRAMEYKEKFIGFVDILGFKNIVEASEAGTGIPVPNVLELLRNLGSPMDREHFNKYGPTVCPESEYIQRDLDFQLTRVTDSILVSAEVSPAGVINLIGRCWSTVINLLENGNLCRGYITRGSIYHTDIEPIGSGYHKALANEKNVTAFKRQADERGTPFVEVDPVVCNYVRNCNDQCVQKMFSRYVKDDGNVTALFPFKRLAHSFVIAGGGRKLDPEKEKSANQNMREMLEMLKERIMGYVTPTNPDAVRKAQHYIAALDAQLEVCKRTDEIINSLNSPYPSNQR